MAILGDKVFMVTDNAHLIAVNRITGRLVWEAVMWDEPQKYGGTVAPLIVKDMVIAGVAGGDWGIRGFVAAYKAATGERVWRHWTVPDEGEPGYRNVERRRSQTRRRLHVADRFLRSLHRHAVLGDRQSVAELGRSRARR